MVPDSQRSTCLCLVNIGSKDMSHHGRVIQFFNNLSCFCVLVANVNNAALTLVYRLGFLEEPLVLLIAGLSLQFELCVVWGHQLRSHQTPTASIFWDFWCEKGSTCVGEIDLQLQVLLSHPPKCLDYRQVALCSVYRSFLYTKIHFTFTIGIFLSIFACAFWMFQNLGASDFHIVKYSSLKGFLFCFC